MPSAVGFLALFALKEPRGEIAEIGEDGSVQMIAVS